MNKPSRRGFPVPIGISIKFKILIDPANYYSGGIVAGNSARSLVDDNDNGPEGENIGGVHFKG